MSENKLVIAVLLGTFMLCLATVVFEHNHKEPPKERQSSSVTINGKVITKENCLAGEVPAGYTVTLGGVLCKNPRE
jgi:type 1 fimbria pilin